MSGDDEGKLAAAINLFTSAVEKLTERLDAAPAMDAKAERKLSLVKSGDLTKQEAALDLKVDVRTVERWIDKKGLPHYKVDDSRQGAVRIPRKEFEIWKARNTK